VKRREFITLLGGATAWTFAVRAQQPAKVMRLGYLAPARLPNLIEALQAGLRDFGYVEGQNLLIEYRLPVCRRTRVVNVQRNFRALPEGPACPLGRLLASPWELVRHS
jgi:hypothetical protein